MTKTVLMVSLALVAGACQAGWESWLRNPLYRASFEAYAPGQELSDIGATNGTWGVPAVPAGAEATAFDQGGVKYIRFETEESGLFFTPWSTGARSLKSVVTSAQLSSCEEEDLPDLSDTDPRGAFAICETNFVGWTAEGWTMLKASLVEAVPGLWYDVSMKFMQDSGGSVKIQYRLRRCDTGDYETLHAADDPESTWFRAGTGASDAVISKIELRGEGSFSCLAGSEPRRGLLIGLVPWREMLIDESAYHHGSGDWYAYDYNREQRLYPTPYVVGGDAYVINVPDGESYAGFKPKKQGSDSREVFEFAVRFMASNDNDATPTNDVCALVRLVEMPIRDVKQVDLDYQFACMANGRWYTNENSAIQADINADYTVEIALDRGEQTVSYRVKKGRGAEAGPYTNLLTNISVSISDPLYTFFGGFGKVYSIKATESSTN